MRAGLIAAAISGVLASGSAAQNIQYSNTITASCVAQATGLAEKKACIGRSSTACMYATADGETTYGMGACLEQERAYWDAVLNVKYRSIRARARAADGEMQSLGSSAPSLVLSLRDMQRAWITYRDATCDFERAQWGGGTGGGPATLGCLMRLTGEQALYLDDAWLGE